MPGFSRCLQTWVFLMQKFGMRDICDHLSSPKNTSKHTSSHTSPLFFTHQNQEIHIYMASHSLLRKSSLTPHREATRDTFIQGQTVTQHISFILKEAAAVCFLESPHGILNFASPPPSPLLLPSHSLSFKLTCISAT